MSYKALTVDVCFISGYPYTLDQKEELYNICNKYLGDFAIFIQCFVFYQLCVRIEIHVAMLQEKKTKLIKYYTYLFLQICVVLGLFTKLGIITPLVVIGRLFRIAPPWLKLYNPNPNPNWEQYPYDSGSKCPIDTGENSPYGGGGAILNKPQFQFHRLSGKTVKQ